MRLASFLKGNLPVCCCVCSYGMLDSRPLPAWAFDVERVYCFCSVVSGCLGSKASNVTVCVCVEGVHNEVWRL